MAGTQRFGNWEYLKSGKSDGDVNVVGALKRSNDVYFYQLGEKFTPQKIKQWAETFGFDKVSGLGIEENPGSVPSPFWKEETLKEKWYTGDTYNFSIGQGYLLVTPLQIARSTSVFANNGSLCDSTLLKTDSDDNKELEGYKAVHCTKLPLSDTTLDVVKQGMVAACATGGTAWPLFNFTVNDYSNAPTPTPTLIPTGETASGSAKIVAKTKVPQRPVELACKTGTAESHYKSGIPYAWFTVYGPVQNPEIVVTVMIEEGGEGSDVAVPVAKEVLKTYFERIQ
jgi:penicillin-binding protein 2